MRSPVHSHRFFGPGDAPEGGQTFGAGFAIAWQRGPLGRGKDRIAQNGAFVEDVIFAAKERLEFYQASRFNCPENALAIEHLEAALAALDSRTRRRESQQTEGTHQGS